MALAYPINCNISGWNCLVVGGGSVGTRRTAGLLECGAIVTVVATKASSELISMSESGKIALLLEPFRPEHLDGMRLAIAAVDNKLVNDAVGEQCRKRNILVNRADDSSQGDFTVPAVIRRGALTLSAATDGSHPRLTAQIAQTLSAMYGPEYEPYVAMLRLVRLEILAEAAAHHEREAAFNALNDHEADLLHLIKSGREAEALHVARGAVSSAIHGLRTHHSSETHQQ